jgi:hypothetical protein
MSDWMMKCPICGYHFWKSVGCPNNCKGEVFMLDDIAKVDNSINHKHPKKGSIMHKYAVIERAPSDKPTWFVTPGKVEIYSRDRRIYSSNSLGACIDRCNEEESAALNGKHVTTATNSTITLLRCPWAVNPECGDAECGNINIKCGECIRDPMLPFRKDYAI